MKKHTKEFILTALFFALLSSCAGMGRNPDTIYVSGTGQVMVKPDTVSFSVEAEEIADTNKEAQNIVSQRIRQTLEILKQAGIEENNISTSSYRFSDAVQYNNQTRENEIIGRRVSMGMRIITTPETNMVNLLDELGQIEKINLSSLTFDLKDKGPYYTEARALAYQKAHAKALELASLSGRRVGKPFSINESFGSPLLQSNSNILLARGAPMAAEASIPGPALPAGELAITSTVDIAFLLKN